MLAKNPPKRVGFLHKFHGRVSETAVQLGGLPDSRKNPCKLSAAKKTSRQRLKVFNSIWKLRTIIRHNFCCFAWKKLNSTTILSIFDTSIIIHPIFWSKLWKKKSRAHRHHIQAVTLNPGIHPSTWHGGDSKVNQCHSQNSILPWQWDCHYKDTLRFGTSESGGLISCQKTTKKTRRAEGVGFLDFFRCFFAFEEA